MIEKDTPKGTQVAYKYRTMSEEFGFIMNTTEKFAFCRFWWKNRPGDLRTRANNEPVEFEDLIKFNSVTPDKLQETIQWIDDQENIAVCDEGEFHRIKIKGEYRIWAFKLDKEYVLLVADRGRINLEDPGADTPAMVYFCDENRRVSASATMNYALDTGMLDGNRSTYMIDPELMEWLNEYAEKADAFLDQTE